jgi:hypothetical protein
VVRLAAVIVVRIGLGPIVVRTLAVLPGRGRVQSMMAIALVVVVAVLAASSVMGRVRRGPGRHGGYGCRGL